MKIPSSSTGLTGEKVEEFIAAGNDIAVPIPRLVGEVSDVFPPLQRVAGGALFISESVQVRITCTNVDQCSADYLHLGVSGEQESMGGIWALCQGNGGRGCSAVGS